MSADEKSKPSPAPKDPVEPTDAVPNPAPVEKVENTDPLPKGGTDLLPHTG